MFSRAANLIKGSDAEREAIKFLKKQGLRIINQNQSFKVGEIDIIATDEDQTVFVEVKYRKNSSHGTAEETVTRQKQTRIKKAAMMWMQKNDPKTNSSYRFDVIAFDGNMQSPNWIKGAF